MNPQSSVLETQMANSEHMVDIDQEMPLPMPVRAADHVWPIDSGLFIVIQFVVNVTQMVASIVLLLVLKVEENSYNHKAFIWIVGYAFGCAATLPLLYFRFRITRTLNSRSIEEVEKFYGVVEFLKMMVSCFFLVWLIFGIVSIPGASLYIHGAPIPETLCLMLFVSGCFVHAIPGMKFASLCLFLPCLICVTIFSRPLPEKPKGATPESIDAMPTYKFKLSKENGGGGVLAEGTKKELTISVEDAVCCICLGQYVENEDLREVSCCKRLFHVECVDKWLKVKARCPLCQFDLAAGGWPCPAT